MAIFKHLVVLPLLGLALATRALAWGPEGHQIVGEIAESLLTPAARQAVDGLLDGARLGDDQIASWPDYIRGAPAWETIYPHNDKWHYIEIELDSERIPPEGTNVIRAIEHFTKVLKSSADKQVRREALCFLVHFVGDIHQPLHCAGRRGDRGGNLQFITAFEGTSHRASYGRTPEDALNLHGTWDYCLVKEALSNQTAHAVAEELAREITSAEQAQWAVAQPETWALESHTLAQTKAYTWKEGQSMPVKGEIVLTPDNYITDRTAVVRRQLQKAGVRLAALVNESLGP